MPDQKKLDDIYGNLVQLRERLGEDASYDVLQEIVAYQFKILTRKWEVTDKDVNDIEAWLRDKNEQIKERQVSKVLDEGSDKKLVEVGKEKPTEVSITPAPGAGNCSANKEACFENGKGTIQSGKLTVENINWVIDKIKEGGSTKINFKNVPKDQRDLVMLCCLQKGMKVSFQGFPKSVEPPFSQELSKTPEFEKNPKQAVEAGVTGMKGERDPKRVASLKNALEKIKAEESRLNAPKENQDQKKDEVEKQTPTPKP